MYIRPAISPVSPVLRLETREPLLVFAPAHSFPPINMGWAGLLGDFDDGSGFFQLALDGVGFVFDDAFLNGGGSGLNQLFGLTQS